MKELLVAVKFSMQHIPVNGINSIKVVQASGRKKTRHFPDRHEKRGRYVHISNTKYYQFLSILSHLKDRQILVITMLLVESLVLKAFSKTVFCFVLGKARKIHLRILYSTVQQDNDYNLLIKTNKIQ